VSATLAGALALGGALLFAAPAHAEGGKIAVVDMQRAVIETNAGAAAQQQLKKILASQQSELEGKQKKLQSDKDALEKSAKAGKVPQAELQHRAEELQRQYAEYQQRLVDSQRSMQQKDGELMQPILQGLLAVVRRIAAQDGYELILEKSAVPYYNSNLDVTDKAIQMFNSQGGPAPAKAPPAPPPKK
jgi:outer membrane protein